MKNFKWINVLKGFGMGTSDLVPGVSGGTIALYLEFMMVLLVPLVAYFQEGFGLV